MPDISMCPGTDCPLKETCYRAKATPSEHWQAWFMYAPYDKDEKRCEHYWEKE